MARLIFCLVSSDNFLQAFKRTQYLKQYAGYRKIQAGEIHHKSEEVSLAIGKLDQQKLKQKEVLTQQEKEKKTLEHIQHHYDKDAKIQKQSCMKAAASVYNPPFGEDVDVIASKVIQIAEKFYQWVNSN